MSFNNYFKAHNSIYTQVKQHDLLAYIAYVIYIVLVDGPGGQCELDRWYVNYVCHSMILSIVCQWYGSEQQQKSTEIFGV